MVHINNGDDRWRMVRERKASEAVFTGRARSRTKEVKMAANVAFLKLGMRGYIRVSC